MYVPSDSATQLLSPQLKLLVIACVGSEFLRSLIPRLTAIISTPDIISNLLRSISADIFNDERFFKTQSL